MIDYFFNKNKDLIFQYIHNYLNTFLYYSIDQFVYYIIQNNKDNSYTTNILMESIGNILMNILQNEGLLYINNIYKSPLHKLILQKDKEIDINILIHIHTPILYIQLIEILNDNKLSCKPINIILTELDKSNSTDKVITKLIETLKQKNIYKSELTQKYNEDYSICLLLKQDKTYNRTVINLNKSATDIIYEKIKKNPCIINNRSYIITINGIEIKIPDNTDNINDLTKICQLLKYIINDYKKVDDNIIIAKDIEYRRYRLYSIKNNNEVTVNISLFKYLNNHPNNYINIINNIRDVCNTINTYNENQSMPDANKKFIKPWIYYDYLYLIMKYMPRTKVFYICDDEDSIQKFLINKSYIIYNYDNAHTEYKYDTLIDPIYITNDKYIVAGVYSEIKNIRVLNMDFNVKYLEDSNKVNSYLKHVFTIIFKCSHINNFNKILIEMSLIEIFFINKTEIIKQFITECGNFLRKDTKNYARGLQYIELYLTKSGYEKLNKFNTEKIRIVTNTFERTEDDSIKNLIEKEKLIICLNIPNSIPGIINNNKMYREYFQYNTHNLLQLSYIMSWGYLNPFILDKITWYKTAFRKKPSDKPS
jgi:hypothetical protein